MTELSLEEKERISEIIISKALKGANKPYALFTGEVDSLVVLHLIRQIQKKEILLSVLQIDTTIGFPEVYQFIEKMRKLWKFQLFRERNEEALRTIEIAEDKELCCRLLKTEALEGTVTKYKIDYLFLANLQDGPKKNPFLFSAENCFQINPVSHFSTKDIWHYIEKYNLPYCSLCKKGYKTISCQPCSLRTQKKKELIKSETADKEVVQKLKALGYV